MGGRGASDWIWWLKTAQGNNVESDIQVHQTPAVQSVSQPAQYDKYQWPYEQQQLLQIEQYRILNT
jgi:hypothetical protein